LFSDRVKHYEEKRIKSWEVDFIMSRGFTGYDWSIHSNVGREGLG
jgi:hypothetical protein